MENYFESQRDQIFRNVEVLIYVFDVESATKEKDMQYFQRCLDAIKRNSKNANIYCLLHKMDLIPKEEDRKKVSQQIRFRVYVHVCMWLKSGYVYVVVLSCASACMCILWMFIFACEGTKADVYRMVCICPCCVRYSRKNERNYKSSRAHSNWLAFERQSGMKLSIRLHEVTACCVLCVLLVYFWSDSLAPTAFAHIHAYIQKNTVNILL